MKDFLQRYLRTDINYLVKSGSWTVVAQVTSAISGIVLTVAMANLLDPGVFGTYKYVIAAATILGAFTLTGMHSVITQATANGHDGALLEGVRIKMKWNLLATVVTLAVASYYFYRGDENLGTLFLILSAFTPLMSTFGLYSSYLTGKEDFKSASLFSSLQSIIQTCILVTTITFTDDPKRIILFHFLGILVANFAFFLLVVWKYRPKSHTSENLGNYGLHLSFMNIFGMISGQLDKILAFQLLGPTQLAMYAIATAPIQQLRSPDKTLGLIALPKLSKRTFPELQETLPRKIFLLIGGFALVSLCYIIVAPYIFKLFFPKYVSAVTYSQVASLVLIFIPTNFFSRAFTAHKKMRELYIINTVNPMLQILLMVILTPLMGLWGLITASLAARTVALIINYVLFVKAK